MKHIKLFLRLPNRGIPFKDNGIIHPSSNIRRLLRIIIKHHKGLIITHQLFTEGDTSKSRTNNYKIYHFANLKLYKIQTTSEDVVIIILAQCFELEFVQPLVAPHILFFITDIFFYTLSF